MKTYLDNLITNSKSLLENDPKNESAYKTLIEGAYCKLLLFNNEWVNFREFCYIRTLSIVTINPPIDTLTQEAIEIAIKVINSFMNLIIHIYWEHVILNRASVATIFFENTLCRRWVTRLKRYPLRQKKLRKHLATISQILTR